MFLVIYETKVKLSLGQSRFMAVNQTFIKFEEADKTAKDVTKKFRCRAWVSEIPDPPLIEMATSAEVMAFKSQNCPECKFSVPYHHAGCSKRSVK